MDEAEEQLEQARSSMDEAIRAWVEVHNRVHGTDYMLNKWYLTAQAMVVSDSESTVTFGEPSKNCPLSDQLGMVAYCETLIKSRIGRDEDE